MNTPSISNLPPEYVEAFERHRQACEAAEVVAKRVRETGIGDERLYELNAKMHEAFDSLEVIRKRLGLTQ